MTKDFVALIRRLDQKPSCLITGSAVGWYGPRQDEILTEDDTYHPVFIHEVCDTWERAAAPIVGMGIRVVQLRSGLVLGVEGDMLARMLTPFEFGAGCQLGDGQQWMPRGTPRPPHNAGTQTNPSVARGKGRTCYGLACLLVHRPRSA